MKCLHSQRIGIRLKGFKLGLIASPRSHILVHIRSNRGFIRNRHTIKISIHSIENSWYS